MIDFSFRGKTDENENINKENLQLGTFHSLRNIRAPCGELQPICFYKLQGVRCESVILAFLFI